MGLMSQVRLPRDLHVLAGRGPRRLSDMSVVVSFEDAVAPPLRPQPFADDLCDKHYWYPQLTIRLVKGMYCSTAHCS